MSSHGKAYNDFVFKRTEEIITKASEINKEYDKLQKELCNGQQELIECLTESQRDIFEKIEELKNIEIAHIRQIMYKMGVKDAMSLARELDEDVIISH